MVELGFINMIKYLLLFLLFVTSPLTYGDVQKDARCLAENIYFEARNQGTAGWLAVTDVTLNRMQSPDFPNTICEVVFQGPVNKDTKIPIRNKCQFSWWCDGLPEDIDNMGLYFEIFYFSNVMLTSERLMFDVTDGATYYHHHSINPKWSKDFEKTIRIGDHIFYKE